MSATPPWEVLALRYATRAARRPEHFHGGDPHDGPMAMDYFVWVLRAAGRTILVDAGFTRAVGDARGRTTLVDVPVGLARLGVDVETVEDCVLTHLHYDHAGHVDRLPAARLWVGAEEMRFWTGRHAGRGAFRALVTPDDVLALVRANFARRVVHVEGEAEVAPGVTLHHVGGHAAGLQVVRVVTADGVVVLASDALHYAENLEQDRPFAIVHDLARMYDAFDRVRELAGPSGTIVPGHDPAVMERFPPAAADLDGTAVRIA